MKSILSYKTEMELMGSWAEMPFMDSTAGSNQSKVQERTQKVLQSTEAPEAACACLSILEPCKKESAAYFGHISVASTKCSGGYIQL